MKKKILSLLTCLCLTVTALFSITACGENPKGNNPGGENPPPAITWNGFYQRLDSKTVLFGSYPQSYVTDSEIIGTLNAQAGTPSTQPSLWTGINYIYKGSKIDLTITQYIDIEQGTDKYRGIYLTTNKPMYTSDNYTFPEGYATDHYSLNSVHWFKYEPIKWNVVDGENGDILTLFSDQVLDSVHYFNGKSDHEVDGVGKVHANNYEYSDARAWLNDYFYNLAFNANQKAIVKSTLVDNSEATLDREESYRCACENTQDNVYLPSYKDINSNFGLTTYEQRKKQASAYSLILGARSVPDGNKNIAAYLTRSPYVFEQIENSNEHKKSNRFVAIEWDGTYVWAQTAETNNGVCPMITIDISSIS